MQENFQNYEGGQGSNLFHSEIVYRKKEFLKKLCFDLKRLCMERVEQELNRKDIQDAGF